MPFQRPSQPNSVEVVFLPAGRDNGATSCGQTCRAVPTGCAARRAAEPAAALYCHRNRKGQQNTRAPGVGTLGLTNVRSVIGGRFADGRKGLDPAWPASPPGRRPIADCRADWLPDLQLQLELNAHAITHLAAHQFDQAEHVLAGAFRLGDNEIGMPLADHRTADARAF